MLPNTQLFNQILEQYSFSVARCCIDSVEPATQSKLIDFINQIDSPLDSTEDTDTTRELAFYQKECPWQEVLSKPVNWHSVHTQWVQGITRQRTKRHERYLAHLEETVRVTEERVNQILSQRSGDSSRASLLRWYQQNLDNYRQYLHTARQVHQTSLQQLQSLQSL